MLVIFELAVVEELDFDQPLVTLVRFCAVVTLTSAQVPGVQWYQSIYVVVGHPVAHFGWL